MNSDAVLVRLRRFLLALAGLLFAGTLVELCALRHWGEPLQITPFAMSLIGLAGISWAWRRPERKTLLTLRALMVPLGLVSVIGVYVHVRGNIEMYVETHAGASILPTLAAGIGGRNPLPAPGMLALAGMLAVAATYYHPALYRTAGLSAAPEPSHERIGETHG